jgi:hypothetical protein
MSGIKIKREYVHYFNPGGYRFSKNIVGIAKIVGDRKLTRIKNYSEGQRILGVTM